MSKPNSTDAWLSGWQSLQEQFAHAWKDGGAGQGTPPLMEAFAQWARMAGADGTGNEVLDRMVGGVRQMVQMMQGALQKAPDAGGPSGADWSAAIASALASAGSPDNPMLDALRQAAGAGARGFDGMFEAFGEVAAPLRRDFQSMMQLPSFGLQRESQERRQQFALALDECREQLDHYNRLMLDASRRALEKLERKLAEHSEPGRQLKSWRELYDTWIDAAEEGYAEVALSPEFRQAYGALVNAQMRVRRHVQQDIEHGTAQLGMPTRGELDAVHRKMVELSRRIAELEHANGVAGIGPADTASSPPPMPSKAARKPRASKPAAAAPRARAAASAPAPKKRGKPAASSRGSAGSSFAERLAAVRKTTRKPRQGGR